MHDPDAEPGVPALFGEHARFDRHCAVPLRTQALRDLASTQRGGDRGRAEAEAADVVETHLRIAHQVVDPRQALDRAREREKQQREPPAVEQIIELKPPIRGEHHRPVRERALDVHERVVLRVHERPRDHRDEEKEEVRERQPERAEEAEHLLDGRMRFFRRKLRDLADGARKRTGLDQRLAHRSSRSQAERRARGTIACAPACLRARSAVQ